jgi:hypothetical protein
MVRLNHFVIYKLKEKTVKNKYSYNSLSMICNLKDVIDNSENLRCMWQVRVLACDQS